VRRLQFLLNYCIDAYIPETGYFGTETQSAVRKLQSYANTRTFGNISFKFTAISADGVAGPYTWGKLNYMMTILSKIYKIKPLN
jgi:peptidoglycan hydrolase-like protein with peptidoglycan-binding domain